jgi:outer membrane immunogenic protein
MSRFVVAVVAAAVTLASIPIASADEAPMTKPAAKPPAKKAQPAPKTRVTKVRVNKMPVKLDPMPMPVPPALGFSWTGFYVGFHDGLMLGTTAARHAGLPAGSATAANDYSFNQEWNGGVVGIQAGFNWQLNQWLAGFEADIAASNIKGTGRVDGVTLRDGTGGSPLTFVSANQTINYLATGRLRLGMLATDNLLIFATGGLAYANMKYSGQFHLTAADYIGSDSVSRSGWTAGAGLEYRFTDAWSVKAEYLYLNLGSRSLLTTSNTVPGFQSQFDFTTRGSLVRVGANYKFDGF